MIFETIKTLLGLLFVIFMPGYLFSLIIFRKLEVIERFCLSIGLSMVIVVSLSFNLSGIGYLTRIKGLTLHNVWISLIGVCVFFLLLMLIIKFKPRIKRWIWKIFMYIKF